MARTKSDTCVTVVNFEREVRPIQAMKYYSTDILHYNQVHLIWVRLNLYLGT